MKRALKQPRELKPTKKKNVSTTALGDTVGQIHMERQDYSKLQTRKVGTAHSLTIIFFFCVKCISTRY